jgi:oligopeptide/dipeptide ABC transporter ATP-binding protein
MSRPPLLEVRGLAVHFVRRPALAERLAGTRPGILRALDGVDLALPAGAALGLVGESGSGKTTLGRVIVGLESPTAGEVLFRGQPIAAAGMASRPQPRAIQMVFQDPYSSLNPRMTVGAALAEPMRTHRLVPPAEIAGRVGELLGQVGLAPAMAERRPGALSGGQRQRVSLARALAMRPTLLVLDEPVSALDVSIQAQILRLLQDLRDRLALTMLFIAHELGVVRAVSTHIAVMYLGRIVEAGPADAVFAAPGHPYTQGLIAAAPRLAGRRRARRAAVLAGEVPSPLAIPPGCRFHPRCPMAEGICRSEPPPLVRLSEHHTSACHFAARSRAPVVSSQREHASHV